MKKLFLVLFLFMSTITYSQIRASFDVVQIVEKDSIGNTLIYYAHSGKNICTIIDKNGNTLSNTNPNLIVIKKEEEIEINFIYDL